MEALEQLAIIGAVFGALALALWALQRRGFVRFNGWGARPRAGRALQLIERLQLTPQHSICLVKLNQRTLVVATAPHSCTLLSETDESGTTNR